MQRLLRVGGNCRLVKISVTEWPDVPVIMAAVIVVRGRHHNASSVPKLVFQTGVSLLDLLDNKILCMQRLPGHIIQLTLIITTYNDAFLLSSSLYHATES